MARTKYIYWVPVLLACFAASAKADPIRYTTAG
jgi:hypothetical protein